MVYARQSDGENICYIIRRFNFNFNLTYIQVCSWTKLHFKHFAEINSYFRNDLTDPTEVLSEFHSLKM